MSTAVKFCEKYCGSDSRAVNNPALNSLNQLTAAAAALTDPVMMTFQVQHYHHRRRFSVLCNIALLLLVFIEHFNFICCYFIFIIDIFTCHIYYFLFIVTFFTE